ncbi:disease resistance protein RPV1-like isoform X31 [Quercus robur]|uniref:disease resistance protein RPV1-like isoform X31 n=1 Tax=Quercus robur TaxID=38942 RepID=UPI0021632EB0|nr:disease resistance protein RPV1-like isoform X31 [Quercus robur]
MSTQGASTSSPSSSSTPRRTYDVFLSFRGEDTRTSFTDHLYNALTRKGIFTFRDDENLERGRFISEELVKAIQESKFAIVILSKNYAFSTWLLDELEHIVRCVEETGLVVVPIFYHVNPSDVRKQTGTFAEAFNAHKKRALDEHKMKTWRTALGVVADLSGWDLKDRHESEFIPKIVEDIDKKLNSKFLIIHENLVGVESMVAELLNCSYLDFENNVCMIGICGMGGIGKTTLAKAVYDMHSNKFDASSFIANVREKSERDCLLQLQKQLLKDISGEINTNISDDCEGVYIIKKRLRDKKVLLVLDDVNDEHQLEKLAGKKGWFRPGSWIIITTRDEHVLVAHEVLKIYRPKGLNNDDALKFFCLKAFKNEQPKEGYTQLSQEFVKYAGGLPLALVTLGSFLVGRPRDDWQSALDYFKENPPKKIFDILKISFDGLEDMWKEVFLDIACFFTGWPKFEVIRILKNCGFKARIGISVLQDKSLLTVIGGNEELGMHDLLQEMGKNIVRSCGELGRQSRLWLFEDLCRVLENNMETNAIQAIVIKKRNAGFNFEEFPEVFSKMTNLRLLIIDELHIPNALNRVPNGLRHLSWKCCSLKCLPSSFEPKELVELDLQYSKCEYLWEGAKCLGNLKSINLSSSENLIWTPDFSRVPRLEVLHLGCCTNLGGLHPSIGQLSKLKSLHLSYCESLTNLPSFSEATSLEVLGLECCTNLVGLHPSFGQLSKLKSLDLSRCTSLTNLPSFSEATSLEVLGLEWCTNLVGLHPSFGQLSKLKSLDLSHCTSLTNLPSFSKATSLEVLGLEGCTNLVGLHPSIGQLSKLKSLHLSHCTSLTNLPSFSEATSLEVLGLEGCTNLIGLHPSIGQLSKLKSLHLSRCTSLTNLPSFSEATSLEVLGLEWCTNLVGLHPSIGQLSKLKSLHLSRCTSLTNLPSFSEATSLEVLGLEGCTNLVGLHPSIGQLSKLKSLHLSRCTSLTNLPSFSEATSLEVLGLEGCTNLVGLHPSIGQLSKLKSLHLSRCTSLTNLPSFSEATSLEVLGLEGCTNLVGLHPSIGQLSKLKSLHLSRCTSLTNLPSFSEATSLEVLGLEWCTNLVGLHPLFGQLSKLKSLHLSYCTSLTNLPSFSEATSLEVLLLEGCTNLVGLHPSIGQLSKLKSLHLSRCTSLTNLPSFLEATSLEVLGLEGCTNLVGLHPSIGQLSKLKSLHLSRCTSLTNLPSFLEATSLEVLGLEGCTNLVGLHPSIGQLSKLKSLHLSRCTSLTNLPSFSEATSLEVLGLEGCTNLVGLHPLFGQLSKLKSLNLSDCTSLTNLPNFSEATSLEVLGLR